MTRISYVLATMRKTWTIFPGRSACHRIISCHWRATSLLRLTSLMAILPLSVLASQVDITITGLVLSGADNSGVFGAPNTNLTGDPYSLVFTFDDTKGIQTMATCNGTPYFISIASTSSSNPGTATLRIGAGSFTFGVLNAAYQADSEAAKNDPPCNDSEIGLAAGDGYFGNGSGLNGTVEAAAGTTFGSNPGWAAPFSDSNLAGGESLQFEISELGTTGQYANGELSAQSITVSGPEVATPEPASLTLVITGTVLLFLAGGLRRRSKRLSSLS
jgi:hypothetical protein